MYVLPIILFIEDNRQLLDFNLLSSIIRGLTVNNIGTVHDRQKKDDL